MKLTREEYDNINEKIEKLAGEAERLKKQIDEAEVEEPREELEVGDVFSYSNGAISIEISDSAAIGWNRGKCYNITIGGPYNCEGAKYLGKANEVLFTREQLKAKFEKMRDLDGYLPSYDDLWAIGFGQKSSFIDNLLDDKNCDGSPVNS